MSKPINPGTPSDGLAACACSGWSRAEMLRGAAAQAGRGLPSIEPGMPLPAGTGLDRRSFLLRSAGLTMAVYGAASMSPRAFEEGIEDAMAAGPGRRGARVGLPVGRDRLAERAGADRRRGVHDPATHARAAHATPRACSPRTRASNGRPRPTSCARSTARARSRCCRAIGYASPNQSHFTSRHYWEVGETNPQGQVGWLGRYIDQHGSSNNPLQGLALDSKLAPSLATASKPVAAVSDLSNYSFNGERRQLAGRDADAAGVRSAGRPLDR